MSSAAARALGNPAAFHAIFFEEADEHLAAIERLLLGIEPAAPAAEDLNAIFRAAHSIKGTGGMLGFVEIAALTHELESLLDLLPLTPEFEHAVLTVSGTAEVDGGALAPGSLGYLGSGRSSLRLSADAPARTCAAIFASSTRCTQNVHFSITPRIRTVTFGFFCNFTISGAPLVVNGAKYSL